MYFLQCLKCTTTNGTTFKDYLPLLTVFVTLTLFIIDRLIAISVRRRDVQRNWYLKVLIEPNISGINEFFDKVAGAYESSSKVLQQSEGIPHSEYTSLKAQV
jgi:hypothetical protein